MEWCKLAMMWCSDMEEEDHEMCQCDGDCSGCDFYEEIDRFQRYSTTP